MDLLGDAELRTIALSKMEGYTTEEIAGQLNCRAAHRGMQVAFDSQPLGKREPVMNADEALPLSLEQKVDQVCTSFETAWKTGAQPLIEDHLAGLSDAEKPEVVRELILLDIFYRRQRGDACTAADYQTRFPEIEPAWLRRR